MGACGCAPGAVGRAVRTGVDGDDHFGVCLGCVTAAPTCRTRESVLIQHEWGVRVPAGGVIAGHSQPQERTVPRADSSPGFALLLALPLPLPAAAPRAATSRTPQDVPRAPCCARSVLLRHWPGTTSVCSLSSCFLVVSRGAERPCAHARIPDDADAAQSCITMDRALRAVAMGVVLDSRQQLLLLCARGV